MTEETKFIVHVFPGSAETLARWGGITNHHLIAYSLSNICAKNYPNWLMCVEVIVCYISVVFFETQCSILVIGRWCSFHKTGVIVADRVGRAWYKDPTVTVVELTEPICDQLLRCLEQNTSSLPLSLQHAANHFCVRVCLQSHCASFPFSILTFRYLRMWRSLHSHLMAFDHQTFLVHSSFNFKLFIVKCEIVEKFSF